MKPNATDRKAWDVEGECADCGCWTGATIYGTPEANRFFTRLKRGEHLCRKCELKRGES